MKETSSSARRYQFILATAALALMAVALCRYFLQSDNMPAELIATHWNRQGQVDGALSRSTLLGILSALALAPLGVVLGLMGFCAPQQDRQPLLLPSLAALTVFLGTLTSTVAWSVAALNRGAPRWQEASSMSGTHVAALVGLPLLAGAGAAWIARTLWRPERREAPLGPSMSLRSGERAFWLGHATAPTWLALGLPLAAGLAWWLTRFVDSFLALFVVLVVTILVDAFSHLRVAVDHRGMSLRYGRLAIVRQLIPLRDILSANARELRPLEHGGWGYRGSLRLFGRAAVVLRGGEALELTLNESRQFLVTVDDAATGAALLNGLLERKALAEENP